MSKAAEKILKNIRATRAQLQARTPELQAALIDRLKAENAKLRAESARLRAVAEVARSVVSATEHHDHGYVMCGDGRALLALEDACAALEDPKEP
jgi:gamma-glutamyl phosphate reductase